MYEQSIRHIDENGTKIWYLPSKGKGYWHRTTGPAIEYADGIKFWYVNDERHRIDGPAIEHTNGAKSWWAKGELHRTDGPAIEYADGTIEWLINGKNITKEIEEWIEEFNIDMNTDEGKMRFKLVWG